MGWARLTHRVALSIAVCIAATSIVSPAAAAAKTEQGPRSKVRVRCGTLSDHHGSKVLGRGAGAAKTDTDTQRCVPKKPEPVAITPPSHESYSAARSQARVPAPATHTHAAPPKAVKLERPFLVRPPVERVQVAREWDQDKQQRLDRFAPSQVERVSTAIVSGGVLWALQSSFWASLLLLGLPLWRHVDLLAIVARAPPDAADDAVPPTPEDERVARILDDDQRRHSN